MLQVEVLRLRALITLQERFPFSDIAIYFQLLLNATVFFCASDSVY